MSVRTLSLLSIGLIGTATFSSIAVDADIDEVMYLPSAGEAFGKFSETAPESPHVQLLDGVLQVQDALMDFEVALKSLEDFVRTHPDHSEARENLARLLAAREHIDEGITPWVQRFVESRNPADTLRSIGDIYSYLAHVSYLRALAYPDEGEILAERLTPRSMVETAARSEGEVLNEVVSGTAPNLAGSPEDAEDPFPAQAQVSPESALGEILSTIEGPADSEQHPNVSIAGSAEAALRNLAIPAVAPDMDTSTAEIYPRSGPGEDSAPAIEGPADSGQHASELTSESVDVAPNDFAIPAGASGTDESTTDTAASRAAAAYFAAVRDAQNKASAKNRVESDAQSASESAERDSGKASSVSWWRVVILAYGLVAGLFLLYRAIKAIRNWIRSLDKDLRRRLQRAAAPLAGPVATVVEAGTGESIFRKNEGQSRLSWLRDPIESRYPLVDARRALPLALGMGLAAAALCWFSIWFLRIPAGWWTLPACGLAGVLGVWFALGWQQARKEAQFVRQFPEIVDQIVRLAGAGVPSVEALSVVTEDAPEPVGPVLQGVCDALLAGLDADTALRLATERVRLAEFTMFAAVLRLQRRSGGGVSTAFSNLSTTLRERRKTALKAHASTAQTRLTLLVLTLMPVVVLLAQKYMAPKSVELLFGTEDGTTLLQWGTGLIVTGLLVARTIAARGSR